MTEERGDCNREMTLLMELARHALKFAAAAPDMHVGRKAALPQGHHWP